MMHRLKILILILIIIQIISCTERIDIELDESAVRLVVEGSVTTDTMVHKVFLTKTTSYYYEESPPAVSGALVTIASGGKNIILTERHPGIYETDSAFFGLEGQTYTLNIVLDAPVGGHSEYSATASMTRYVALDSVALHFQSEWSDSGFYEIRGFLQDPSTAEYYRFLIARNGTMLTDTLSEWGLTDDLFFNGQYVRGATIAFLDQGVEDEKLRPGDEVTVELNSISSDYSEFLRGAQFESFGSIPLFSGPAANVKGNISNGAIGFFAAYTTSRARVKLADGAQGK